MKQEGEERQGQKGFVEVSRSLKGRIYGERECGNISFENGTFIVFKSS